MNAGEIMDALRRGSLEALWVIGANPLLGGQQADPRATFIVVHDMFLTETAQYANVILPVFSAYEKAGTLTNTCGEVQRQKRGGTFEGARSDLEIIHELASLLDANFGHPDPDRVFTEIRSIVKGYGVSMVQLLAGNSALSAPVNGRVPHRGAELIRPNHDSLFTAGTLGRYSASLNAVLEKHLRQAGEPEKTV
jgi:NADH-quinone oxidoreductase subunit G